MQYLQRLPLLLALAGSLLFGLISLISNKSHNEALIQMVFAMVIFFVIGLFIRSTILNIKMHVDDKRRKQEELERIQKKKEEAEAKKREKTEEFLEQTIDDAVHNLHDESFDPLPVSEFIQKELKSN